MMKALTIIHVIISLALVVVVLMQHGKQQGLSGAIAGGAETFFGKNKGKTVDAMLKKFTAVVAILFIISSVTFAAMAINVYNKDREIEPTETETTTDGENGDQASAGENGIQASMDENGNLVDAEGNILVTAEDMAASQAEQDAQTDGEAPAGDTAAPAEGEAPADDTAADSAAE